MKRAGPATTVDGYLAALPADQRAALERLRRTIRSVVPKAEERISYGLAAFRLDRMLVGFGATSKHCAFYLMSSTVLDGFRSELEGCDISKGTIRFQPDAPIPAALVKRLVKARLAENALAARR
jgi:uncharacterized protein YdhG (YjbR/CyaY superfamily)